MRLYTVHMRHPTLDPLRDIRLVKDGFCWPAFFFSIAWALWNRMWLAAAGLLAAGLLLDAALAFSGADDGTQAVVLIGFAVLVGLIANDLRRWTLFRRGYLDMGAVSGDDQDAAERRFWEHRPQLVADLSR